MPCEHCHIGRHQPAFAPYIQWFNGQIMVISNAPASSCDVCGYMEYDAYFIHKLNHLLDQFSENVQDSGVVYQQAVMAALPPFLSTRGSR